MADTLSATGIAVVTGAASGIGQATARLLAETGAPLLLCDINADRLAQTAAELPGQPEMLAADISGPDFGEALARALADRPIAALVHCAGVSPTLEGRPERVLEINLAATFRLVEVIRPRMAEGAAVVLFASSAAHQMGAEIGAVTTPEQEASLLPLSPNSGVAYSVSKRGVYLLVRREAKAFGARGARIASISPGVIETPMGRSEMAQQPIMKRWSKLRAAAPGARRGGSFRGRLPVLARGQLRDGNGHPGRWRLHDNARAGAWLKAGFADIAAVGLPLYLS